VLVDSPIFNKGDRLNTTWKVSESVRSTFFTLFPCSQLHSKQKAIDIDLITQVTFAVRNDSYLSASKRKGSLPEETQNGANPSLGGLESTVI
jgi:hypothetical protein